MTSQKQTYSQDFTKRPNDYLTRKEAADYLRISVRLLDQKAAKGEIPYYKLGNGATNRVLYNMRDLNKYIEQFRVEF